MRIRNSGVDHSSGFMLSIGNPKYFKTKKPVGCQTHRPKLHLLNRWLVQCKRHASRRNRQARLSSPLPRHSTKNERLRSLKGQKRQHQVHRRWSDHRKILQMTQSRRLILNIERRCSACCYDSRKSSDHNIAS